ncbi:hypothetical protein NIES3974_06320 [Calothrix sp. NIES-3974]|nr:hypothetical protein NIES3974_06320 [Calothrix sp. NIES-3974]
MERSRVSFLINHHIVPVRLRLYTFRQIYQQFINISYLKAICIVSSAIQQVGIGGICKFIPDGKAAKTRN